MTTPMSELTLDRWNDDDVKRLAADKIAAALREAWNEALEKAAVICDMEHEDPGDCTEDVLVRASAAIRALRNKP